MCLLKEEHNTMIRFDNNMINHGCRLNPFCFLRNISCSRKSSCSLQSSSNLVNLRRDERARINKNFKLLPLASETYTEKIEAADICRGNDKSNQKQISYWPQSICYDSYLTY
ncbi:hypothetical protein Droror1_Dr00020623 [Drosera rotundifolia]